MWKNGKNKNWRGVYRLSAARTTNLSRVQVSVSMVGTSKLFWLYTHPGDWKGHFNIALSYMYVSAAMSCLQVLIQGEKYKK